MNRKQSSAIELMSSISAVLLCGALMPALAQKTPATVTRAAHVQPAPGRAPAGRKLVKIRARGGDTLEMLADRFGIEAGELAQLNGLPVRVALQQGRELLIPLPTPESLKAASEKMARQGGADDSDAQEPAGAWENVNGVLFLKGTVSRQPEPERAKTRAKVVEVSEEGQSTAAQPVWIYLVGGARVEADSVNETEAGVWYTRGSLTIFVERSRVERVERERPSGSSSSPESRTERGWSTGNPTFDRLIRENGARFGVDPYLIFCVMETESQFKPWVVSPKGARGLMQLMPGTAATLGVRKPMDPADNIMGGTKYLKMLLEQFGGRVDLVLAGYNAGEGAVMKYGGRVPPYRETRNYVQRISKRYGQSVSPVGGGAETSPAPGGFR